MMVARFINVTTKLLVYANGLYGPKPEAHNLPSRWRSTARMSKKMDTVWDAPAHTIAKIAMVRAYLYVWLSVLGATFRGRDLWSIDGFAGPGEYKNYSDGSPIAALKAAEQALVDGTRWSAGSVHCVFVEEDKKRYANLQEKLVSVPENKRIQRHSYNDTFINGIAQLRGELSNPFSRGDPIFAFVDPFGAEGLAFTVVKELIANQTCEVLVNLDLDGIARIYHAGDFANYRERLNEVFGDSDWEQELAGVAKHDVERKLLSMYKRRLRAIPDVNYAFSFEMRTSKNQIGYHLVFASKHPLGLEKMKEVMKSIAKDGSYTFSDDNENAQGLFRYDDPDYYAAEVHKHFNGRTVSYGEVNDFALNESPFVNCKAMLRVLEKGKRIKVTCTGTRRTGDFPERVQEGMSIEFLA
jgi:three-Cys-motif partner protein